MRIAQNALRKHQKEEINRRKTIPRVYAMPFCFILICGGLCALFLKAATFLNEREREREKERDSFHLVQIIYSNQLIN